AGEKLEQLKKESEEKDALPDDDRLRNEFDMDDEAIAELKKEFAQPVEKPEPTDDELPPPPEFPLDDPDLWAPNDEPESQPTPVPMPTNPTFVPTPNGLPS